MNRKQAAATPSAEDISRHEEAAPTQEEIEDEIYVDGLSSGHAAGFNRCLELVRWAAAKHGVDEKTIRRILESLSTGP